MFDIPYEILGQFFCLCVSTRVGLNILGLLSEYVFSSTFIFKKVGDWAVVTGATDGIGLSYARKLAKQGQSIVLISRNPDKLKKVAQDIEQEYKVSTKCVPADFSRSDIYTDIEKEISNLNISVLVNNVGMSYDYPEYFSEINDLSNFIGKMLSINVTSALKMTELVLPGFTKKNAGVILNISSASACKPTPLLTLYSASKQFVDTFSKALNCEYATKGIIIQSITPFFVCTKLSKIRRSSFFVPTPDVYVSKALKTVGKSTSTYGYLPHALQGMVIHSLPEWLYMRLSFSQMKGVRAHALRKKHTMKKE